MKHLFIALLLVLSFTSYGQSNASDTTHFLLPEGTLVKAIILDDISGKEVNVGQRIDFELNEDIIIQDKVAIHKGAKIAGTVTEAESSKALGKKGKLAFSIDYLYVPNGKIVKLRSQVEKNLKGSGAAIGAGAVLVSPVALLFHGKNAKYKKGDLFTAYVDKDVQL
jgi:hypothetical protein